MNPMVDGMWARQSPDKCDKCVGCNDVRAVVGRRKLSRIVVVEAEVDGPLRLSGAAFPRRGKNDYGMAVVWSRP